MFQKITDKSYFIILILWLISSFVFFYYVKIRYGEPPIYGNIDWERYFNGANSIISLQWPEWPSKFYISYLLYLSLSLKFYFPLSSLMFNCFFNLISSYLIFKITLNLFNIRAAWISIIIFLFYPYVQMWVYFIQPVSFFSFCILLLTLLITFKLNLRISILILIAGLMVLSARPNGIGIYLSLVIFLFSKYLQFKNKDYLLLFFFSFFIFITYFFYLKSGLSLIPIYETWFMEDIKQFGFVIPELNTTNLSKCLNFTDEKILNLNRENSGKTNLSFWACSLYYNPIDVIKIFSYRAFAMLSYIKPVFSTKHNIFSVLTLFPIYVFFIFSLIKFYNLKLNFIFLSLIIFIFLSCIAVVDGDNRYFSAIFPTIIIVSSGGISYFVKLVGLYLKKI